MAQKFHKRFNIEIDFDEAKRRFVNRAHNAITYDILGDVVTFNSISKVEEVERFVCTKLGEQWRGRGCLPSIMGNNFFIHVQALEALYNHPAASMKTGPAIMQILGDSEIDLGIRWNNGHFLPSGAPLLDEKLVNDVLSCLIDPKFEGVRKPFHKGLEHLLQSVSKPKFLTDVVTDMYEALEALAKIMTRSDRELSANAQSFIVAVQVSEDYRRILKEYIAYANRMGRHAGEQGQPKPPLTRKEVESFVYLTGLFIRLAVVPENQV